MGTKSRSRWCNISLFGNLCNNDIYDEKSHDFGSTDLPMDVDQFHKTLEKSDFYRKFQNRLNF